MFLVLLVRLRQTCFSVCVKRLVSLFQQGNQRIMAYLGTQHLHHKIFPQCITLGVFSNRTDIAPLTEKELYRNHFQKSCPHYENTVAGIYKLEHFVFPTSSTGHIPFTPLRTCAASEPTLRFLIIEELHLSPKTPQGCHGSVQKDVETP